MNFREIRDGSVWGQKAHRFLVAPEVKMATASHDDIILTCIGEL